MKKMSSLLLSKQNDFKGNISVKTETADINDKDFNAPLLKVWQISGVKSRSTFLIGTGHTF